MDQEQYLHLPHHSMRKHVQKPISKPTIRTKTINMQKPSRILHAHLLPDLARLTVQHNPLPIDAPNSFTRHIRRTLTRRSLRSKTTNLIN
ncbi:MAG: hypothetical protein QXW09_08165 [Thermoproteota archaeon]